MEMWSKYYDLLYEPEHDKTYNNTCATSNLDSDFFDYHMSNLSKSIWQLDVSKKY